MTPGTARPPHVVVYKPQGATPLEALGALRAMRADLAHAKLGYAGRLDPMAEGLLLVLVDGENAQIDRHLALDKTYDVDVLIGLATDTYDALGLIVASDLGAGAIDRARVRTALDGFEGARPQRVPPYSSVPLRGRPLYYWARRGALDPADVPTRVRTIARIELTAYRAVGPRELGATVARGVGRVRGDFRQDRVLARWTEVLDQAAHVGALFPIASLRVECASGTYMRSLADDVGRALGSCALALAIVRTRIGTHALADAIRLE